MRVGVIFYQGGIIVESCTYTHRQQSELVTEFLIMITRLILISHHQIARRFITKSNQDPHGFDIHCLHQPGTHLHNKITRVGKTI